MVSAPVKPMPPEEDELELIVIVLAVFE